MSELLIENLTAQSYAIIDDFLSATEVEQLASNLLLYHTRGSFKNAGIGQGVAQQIQNAIRGDQILWLDEHTTNVAEQVFLEKIEALRILLNRACYLGLKDAEIHYAMYPVGTFYKRHLDRFQKDSRRKISVICYLNQGWETTDGGELVIYTTNAAGEEIPIKVAPTAGRLVCFEADRLEHEVLPATRPRMSLTGWMRVY